MGWRIKDWNKFQHYHSDKRNPDWIKLYRGLLDDVEWHDLDPNAAKSLVMLWLLASENGGLLPCERKIAFRLRLTETQVKSTFSKLSHWLEHDASDALADRYQSDSLEREGDREEEGDEKETQTARDVQTAFEAYNEVAEKHALPLAERLTSQRRDKLRSRLREGGLPEWMRALENLTQQPFCLGQGPKGWRANLDFLLQPSSYVKVLEMAFLEGRGPPPKRSRTQEASEEWLEEIQNRGDRNSERRICGAGGEHVAGELLEPTPRPENRFAAANDRLCREAEDVVAEDGPPPRRVFG